MKCKLNEQYVIKMDIYNIGQYYFSEEDADFLKTNNRSIDNLFSRSYFLGVINFFLKYFYFILFGSKRFPQKEEGSTRVLFYGLSRNNRLSLQPIIGKLGERNAISFINQNDFPHWKLYYHAMPHFFELIKEVRKADKKKRKVLKFFFPKFWRMYGCPPVINEMLDIYKPEVVVLANDHLEFNRCLLEICKQRGLNTIYVQHASVGTHFPPLQFSFSLLDGMDAFLKYKAIGNLQGKIYLLGGVRFDVVRPVYFNNPQDTVAGVAINFVDNEDKVKELCVALQSLKGKDGTPLKVLFRPHPQMKEDGWKTWCLEHGILFSSPKEESSFEFIGKTTFVVANQCSIHLDVAMCHKYSIIYNMSDFQGRDEYLFLQKGLVKEIKEISEIQSIISNTVLSSFNDETIRYFSCSYGTSYEGDVAGIICDLINCLLEGKDDIFNEKHRFSIYENSDEYCVYQINQ